MFILLFTLTLTHVIFIICVFIHIRRPLPSLGLGPLNGCLQESAWEMQLMDIPGAIHSWLMQVITNSIPTWCQESRFHVVPRV